MKQIKLSKPKFSWKIKLLAGLIILLIGFGLGFKLVKEVNFWFSTHELIFNKVVNLELKPPVEIREREAKTQEIIRIIETIPAPEDLETDVEKTVYEVFGIENYRLALAIFSAESGLREDAYNVNVNSSIDYGVAQINSSNWKLPGCSLKEIVDTRKNILCAYSIWDRGDGLEGNKKGNFHAWSAFKNGSFIGKLE